MRDKNKMARKLYSLIITTNDNEEEAKLIARTLVEEGLVACVNITLADSIYTWKGKVVEDSEFMLLMKTKTELFDLVKKRILELHHYELPEIISFEIKDGTDDYLDWIKRQTI